MAKAKATTIVLDDDFKRVLPEQTTDERSALRESIIAEGGARDPVVVWKGKGILVDGYNRYDICNGEGLPFQVVEKTFGSRAAVRRWIFENQLSRRNLTPQRASLIRGQLYNATKGGGGNAAKAIAKKTGRSERQIKRDGVRATTIDGLSKSVRDSVAQSDLSSASIMWLASMPAAEQRASVKKLLADPSRATANGTPTASPAKAKAKATPTAKPIEQEVAEIRKLIEKAARRSAGVRPARAILVALDAATTALAKVKSFG